MRPFILFEEDVIEAGDFVRPLDLTFDGQSDYLHTTNTYSGRPENHTRWVAIERLGMQRWIGKRVGDLNKVMDDLETPHQWTSRYEFARGAMPDFHQLPETDQEHRARMDKAKLPFGKYKGRTLKYVRDHDGPYYSWMRSEGLDKKWCDK